MLEVSYRSVVAAGWWAHARRPFFMLADIAANARRKARGKTTAVISPLALEAVRRIDALSDIERAINGQSAERRRAVRQEASAPLVADLEVWLREQRAKLSRGNDLARAMDSLKDGARARSAVILRPTLASDRADAPRRRPAASLGCGGAWSNCDRQALPAGCLRR